MKTIHLNDLQKVVLKDYANGAFVHLLADDAFVDLNCLKDPMLRFMLVELSDKRACRTAAEGTRRIIKAQSELEVILKALMLLEEAMLSKPKALAA